MLGRSLEQAVLGAWRNEQKTSIRRQPRSHSAATDGLVEVDMGRRKVVKRLTLPGPGLAIADSGDGFFVATGDQNDHRAVNLHRLADDGSVLWTSGPHPIGDRTLLVMKDRVLYGGTTQIVSLDLTTGQSLP